MTKKHISVEFRLGLELKQAFRVALARSPYKNNRAWGRAQVIRLCLEYAPQDLKELTGIENNQKKA